MTGAVVGGVYAVAGAVFVTLVGVVRPVEGVALNDESSASKPSALLLVAAGNFAAGTVVEGVVATIGAGVAAEVECARLDAYPTKSTAVVSDPKRIVCVTNRARANR